MAEEIKLLLVDDDEDFVRTLAERLEMRDLNSEIAEDGEKALEYIRNVEPDVMVLDLKMPGIDGIEVLRQVKNMFPNIQVIIYTGYATDLDEAEARNLGIFDFLKKPVDIEVLVERIKAAYEAKKASFSSYMEAVAFAEEGEADLAKSTLKR